MKVELVFKNYAGEFYSLEKEVCSPSLFTYLTDDNDEFFFDVQDFLLGSVDKSYYLVDVRDISLANF